MPFKKQAARFIVSPKGKKRNLGMNNRIKFLPNLLPIRLYSALDRHVLHEQQYKGSTFVTLASTYSNLDISSMTNMDTTLQLSSLSRRHVHGLVRFLAYIRILKLAVFILVAALHSLNKSLSLLHYESSVI